MIRFLAMFNTNNRRVEALGSIFKERTDELDALFNGPTVVYIDWANVIHWQDKVDWHFHLQRIKQFLDAFDQVKKVRLYCGTLEGNQRSESQVREASEKDGYEVCTKSVKLMNWSIDVSSIPVDSPEILKSFLRKSLLQKIDIETVGFLNSKLKTFNQQGVLALEEKKCNFDVEMGRDMLSDFLEKKYETFVLWSGDSDFQSPIKQLVSDGKSVVIFSMSGSVSPEIGETGVPIFGVKKIKEFICWPRELSESIRSKISAYLDSQRDPREEAPKL